MISATVRSLKPRPVFIKEAVVSNLSRRLYSGLSTVQPDAPELRKDSTSVDNDMPTEIENPFKKEKSQCILCKMNVRPDYKNTKLLSQFVSPYTGRVYGRHITGLCRRRQEQVETEINKSREAGFMPYYFKDPVYTDDPKIVSPEKPFRPHNF